MGLIKKHIYAPSSYNALRRNGFEATDVAHSADQAREMARNYPDDYRAVVIKTGRQFGNPKVYPYHIMMKQRQRLGF